MASVEELPPETGAHSEGFATPIGGGLPSESGDVVAHDLQEQFRGELLQLARSLEPPPPSAATVADLSVERDASVQEIVTKLDRYGA